MITIQVHCPNCDSIDVIKAGQQPNGAQRYRCQNTVCAQRAFRRELSLDPPHRPEHVAS